MGILINIRFKMRLTSCNRSAKSHADVYTIELYHRYRWPGSRNRL